jgi:5-methylcytosine-specific restriction endonuclease McrA
MQKERHPLWQGGISRQPYAFDFNEKLKNIIKERDNFCCQLCGSQKKLCIHHIDYKKSNSDEDNLITLCQSCHSKTNANREFWINYFRSSHENNKSGSA